MTTKIDPRHFHAMGGDGCSADRYHPLVGNKESPAAGTVFGCTATEADNVFENGGESAIIWGIRADAASAVAIAVFDGPVEAGAGIIGVVQSTTFAEGQSQFPLMCPNGFHVDVSAIGTWTLSWSPLPQRGK